MSLDPSRFDIRRNQVDAECECGYQFQVPASMRGGIVNCPKCQRIVEISPGIEPLYWLIVALGVIIGLALTALAAAAGGPVAGLVTFLVCAGLMWLILAMI